MNFLFTKTIPLDSFNLLSHPDTKLIVHLRDVAKNVYEKVKNLNVSEKVKKSAVYAALCHDFGKATIYFQKRLKTGKKNKYSNHSLISALFGLFVTNDPLVFLAIRYHHLNLQDLVDMQQVDAYEIEKVFTMIEGLDEEVERIYEFFGIEFRIDDFKNWLEKNSDEWGFEIEIEKDFYDFLVIFSSLISADKEEAIFKGEKENIKVEFKNDFVDKYKKAYIKPKYDIDFIREKIYQSISDIDLTKDIFFLELPTGAGKTFGLIKLATMLKKDKILYLLPYITLIEQNASIFKDILKFNGVNVDDNRIFFEKHSLSGEFKVNSENEYDLDKKAFLSDSFDTKVLVTTFHQFFYSFFKSQNSFLKRAINIRNSVIILDEIQTIKEEFFSVIESLFDFLISKFNCKIIIATATLPPIEAKNYFHLNINHILSDEEIEFFNRYDINLEIKEFNEEEVLEYIENRFDLKKDLLFRVNTINLANFLFDQFNNSILLTSAIPPILRRERIESIKQKGGLVIATQLIQAGVDISLEGGFEELAPLDMLVQSMGRRNRSGEKQRGFADLVRIKYKGFDGSNVYPRGLINKTLMVIEDKSIVDEIEFRELLKKYYFYFAKDKRFLNILENLNFKTLDKEFNLIESVKTVSFFCILDKKSELLWQKIVEIDEKSKDLGENFWEKKRELEEEFNKIKKDVFSYVVNVRIYKDYDLSKFTKAMFLYLANEEIFDYDKGVRLDLKKEELFW